MELGIDVESPFVCSVLVIVMYRALTIGHLCYLIATGATYCMNLLKRINVGFITTGNKIGGLRLNVLDERLKRTRFNSLLDVLILHNNIRTFTAGIDTHETPIHFNPMTPTVQLSVARGVFHFSESL